MPVISPYFGCIWFTMLAYLMVQPPPLRIASRW